MNWVLSMQVTECLELRYSLLKIQTLKQFDIESTPLLEWIVMTDNETSKERKLYLPIFVQHWKYRKEEIELCIEIIAQDDIQRKYKLI